MRDVERQFDSVAGCGRAGSQELIGRTMRILSQQAKKKSKLYALHALEVECLVEGKARTRYEFGAKVPITTTQRNGLCEMRSTPRNSYDGHTLTDALEHAAILSDVTPAVQSTGRRSHKSGRQA